MSEGNGAGAVDDRALAPFGRRACEVTAVRETGGYRVFTALDKGTDPPAPEPAAGQFYMLSAASWGEAVGRPFLPRAFSFARSTARGTGIALEFLLEAVGPGTETLAALEPGDRVELTGPLGSPFSPPRKLNPNTTGAILVGGGIGIAPLAVWRAELAGLGVPARALLGFRDKTHSGGIELFDCSEVRLASEDGHVGHRGYVTDLLGVLLEGEDASETAAVYACGPPAMLEAVREMCAARDVVCELAMESPMACGFCACFCCAVPLADGGYMRLCVDGPVVRGNEIATALVAGAGH
ncbi:MAG: dihydroorotate dehydrogenase electron transfer subunit [Solirubrobacterales bacterium]